MNNLSKTLGLSAAMFLFAMMVAGCGGDKQTALLPVGEMQEYRDPLYGFHFQYPQGWAAEGEAGRSRIYNSPAGRDRFLEPTGPYPDGVVITVDVIKTATPAEEKTKLVAELASSGYVVGQESATTLGGKDGIKVPYTANYSSKVKVTGHHIYVMMDTVVYDMSFAGFGDLYASHQTIFDSVTRSFAFPRPVEPGRDATLPSEVLTPYDAKMFSFQYPENFNFVNVPKGNNELALGLRGVRQDCSILFHVFGAKGLTLEKAFDQNKGKYAGASTGKATISGLPALTLTYAPTREVERRFYFTVKDDKVYRVTLDWYRPQRAEYLTAYEKVISSIKLK